MSSKINSTKTGEKEQAKQKLIQKLIKIKHGSQNLFKLFRCHNPMKSCSLLSILLFFLPPPR